MDHFYITVTDSKLQNTWVALQKLALLLNSNNGTLNISNEEGRRGFFRKVDYLQKTYPYRPTANCPVIGRQILFYRDKVIYQMIRLCIYLVISRYIYFAIFEALSLNYTTEITNRNLYIVALK